MKLPKNYKILNDELSDFISYISSEKGLARHSIDAYRRDTLALAHYLKETGLHSFSQAEESDIISFLCRLKNNQYAPSSMARTLIAIKVLYKFLKREGLAKSNIALYLEAPKLWQIIPEILNGDEIGRLLTQPDDQTYCGARDKVILEILYGSGLESPNFAALRFIRSTTFL